MVVLSSFSLPVRGNLIQASAGPISWVIGCMLILPHEFA